MVEVLNQIKKLTGKYQTPFGLAVWGFTAPGEAKEILVDSEGRLQVVGEFTGEVTVPNIDVLLSTRASESTLSSVLSKLAGGLPAALTAQGNLKIAPLETLKGDWLNAIPNPSNLDVLLSTRASETTLSGAKSDLDSMKNALASVGTDSLLIKTV